MWNPWETSKFANLQKIYFHEIKNNFCFNFFFDSDVRLLLQPRSCINWRRLTPEKMRKAHHDDNSNNNNNSNSNNNNTLSNFILRPFFQSPKRDRERERGRERERERERGKERERERESEREKVLLHHLVWEYEREKESMKREGERGREVERYFLMVVVLHMVNNCNL